MRTCLRSKPPIRPEGDFTKWDQLTKKYSGVRYGTQTHKNLFFQKHPWGWSGYVEVTALSSALTNRGCFMQSNQPMKILNRQRTRGFSVVTMAHQFHGPAGPEPIIYGGYPVTRGLIRPRAPAQSAPRVKSERLSKMSIYLGRCVPTGVSV